MEVCKAVMFCMGAACVLGGRAESLSKRRNSVAISLFLDH